MKRGGPAGIPVFFSLILKKYFCTTKEICKKYHKKKEYRKLTGETGEAYNMSIKRHVVFD